MKAVIAVLIVFVIIITLIVANLVSKDNDRKREELAFTTEVQRGRDYYKQISDRLSGIEKYRDQAEAHLSAVSNEIAAVLSTQDGMKIFGPNWRKSGATALMPSRPVIQAPVPASASVKAITPAAIPTPPAPPPPPPKKEPQGPRVDEAGREIPEGLEDLAELQAANKKPENPPTPASAPAPALKDNASVMVDEKGREAPMGMLDDMKAKLTSQMPGRMDSAASSEPSVTPDQIKEMKGHYDKVKAVAAKVEQGIADAEALVEQAGDLFTKVQQSGTSGAAFVLNKGGPALVENAVTLAKSMPPLIDEMKVVPARVALIRAAIESDRQKKKGEEAKARVAAETEARKKAELAKLTKPLEGKDTLIRNFGFKQVMTSLQDVQKSLEFEESKKLLVPPIRRFEVLQQFMTWIIQSINKKPFGYGWKTAGAAYDITAADENGITVQGKEMAWTAIPPARIIYIAQNYIQNLPRFGQEAGTANFGAAIFCKTFGMEKEAIDYRKSATDISKLISEEIDSVMNFEPLPASAETAK